MNNVIRKAARAGTMLVFTAIVSLTLATPAFAKGGKDKKKDAPEISASAAGPAAAALVVGMLLVASRAQRGTRSLPSAS